MFRLRRKEINVRIKGFSCTRRGKDSEPGGNVIDQKEEKRISWRKKGLGSMR